MAAPVAARASSTPMMTASNMPFTDKVFDLVGGGHRASPASSSESFPARSASNTGVQSNSTDANSTFESTGNISLTGHSNRG